MSFLFLAIGFVIMVFGADYFVKGAVNIAGRLGLPSLVIGLTIVAWGTSMPELAVSLGAAGKDAAGLAVGNVIGSNIANVLLIGGVAAILLPLSCPPSALRRDAIWLGLATLAASVMGVLGELSVWMGLVLIGMLIVQTFMIYRAVAAGNISTDDVEMPDDDDASMPLQKAIFLFVLGLIAVIGGSQLLVEHAIEIAEMLNVPDAIIGLTMVAVGTSLPELVTTIAAARQRQVDVIIGNIVGSNIANIVLVLGVVALAAPGDIPASLLDGDGLIMVITSALFVGILLLSRQIGRLWGLCFLAAYALYVAWQFEFFGLVG